MDFSEWNVKLFSRYQFARACNCVHLQPRWKFVARLLNHVQEKFDAIVLLQFAQSSKKNKVVENIARGASSLIAGKGQKNLDFFENYRKKQIFCALQRFHATKTGICGFHSVDEALSKNAIFEKFVSNVAKVDLRRKFQMKGQRRGFVLWERFRGNRQNCVQSFRLGRWNHQTLIMLWQAFQARKKMELLLCFYYFLPALKKRR